MVTTRRQQQQQQQVNQEKLSKKDDKKKRSLSTVAVLNDPEPLMKQQKTIIDNKKGKKSNNTKPLVALSSSTPKADCNENQNLINALHELLEAVSNAQIVDNKLRFQATQLRKVIETLSKFKTKITSGQALAKPGKDKVEGLGKGTATYIDDFLTNGHIAAINEYKEMRNKYDKEHANNSNNKEGNIDDENNNNIIMINRAPILTFWVTIVSKRIGYTHDEALTHGKWISTILAKSKGKSLGIFDNNNKKKGSKNEYNNDNNPKEHVFGHIHVPVQSNVVGQRLAMMGTKPINPNDVEKYILNSLGGNIENIQTCLEQLANSIEPNTIKEQAYELYEKLRPEWQGWGKPGKLDLNKIRLLSQQQQQSK